MSSPLASLNNTFEEQEKNDEEQEQNEQKNHLLWLQTNWHNTLCKPTKIQKMKNQLRQSNYELNELSQRVETIGATFKIIDKLIQENNITSTFSYEPSTKECSICKTHGTECILNCGHSFHVHCIQKWFKNNNTCPNCRAINHHQLNL